MSEVSAFLQLVLGGLRIGAVYGLSAAGLVVIHKATKIVNFAHGALIMLGGYGAFVGLQSLGLPYWLVYALAPASVGVIAAGMEFAVLRPLRKADAFSVIVTTVFLAVLISEIVNIVFESDVRNVPAVIGGPPFRLGRIIVTRETLWVGGGALGCGVLGAWLFARAPMGRAMRAMAANVRGAQLCGYSVDRVYGQAWLLGGGLAGLAGVFAAPLLGVSPDMAGFAIVPAFVAAIIGGFDSVAGAILGGLILGVLETMTAAYLSSAMKSALTFVILLAVLLFRPEGLFRERKVRVV